jgi:molybdopterin molybdotransferase
MDGFAIRSVDTLSESHLVELRVAGAVQAGSLDPGSISQGEAARIMTGAPLPDGADAVIPFEETETREDVVVLPSGRKSGACVRPAGLDIKPGDRVLEPSARVGPRQIALAASVGASRLMVRQRPVVAILATGDELVEPGQSLKPGQIYNSNAHGLVAAVRELGAVPRLLAPARDDPDALRTIFRSLAGVDLILTSGGVSVGDYDFVKLVIGELGTVDFWRIRMRPGKPLMFGSLGAAGAPDGTTIMGLPGNPTSTMVTFFIFARPAILKLMGDPKPIPEPLLVVTDDDLDNRGGRETYFRVRLETRDGHLHAGLSGGQDSSMLLPLSRANALARVPAAIEHVAAGESVDVITLT